MSIKHKDKFRAKKEWAVRIDRPEEIHGIPSLYYTDEEIEKYAKSGGMKKTQENITYRILELLNIEKHKKILDIGCGVGYTTNVYQNEGYEVIGLDVLPKMLEKAKAKGLNVVKGDMRNLKDIFKEKEFDAVVSASALQWLKAKEDIEKVASGINYILKNKGKIVIQFYPKSYEELVSTAKIFKKCGFEGEIITDNPDKSIKRVIYLVMKKI